MVFSRRRNKSRMTIADALHGTRVGRLQSVGYMQVIPLLSDLEDEAAEFHKTVHRPWGSFSILEDADDCKVKRLVVKPGQVLSLQRHQRRQRRRHHRCGSGDRDGHARPR